MIKEIELIDKDNITDKLESFVKVFCEEDMEKYIDLIKGVNYAIAMIAVTNPKAKIFEEEDDEEKNDAKDESFSKAEKVIDDISDYITRYDGNLSDSAKIAHIHGLLAAYYYGKRLGSDS